MSRENVEVVRQVYEAAARRDTEKVLAYYDPEVVWDSTRSPFTRLVAGGLYRGHDGLRRFFSEWHEAWDNVEDVCEELIDAGDHVVVRDLARGRGRTSGAEVEGSQYGVWTLRDGKIVRVAWFPTRAEALEAAGVPE